MGSRTHWSWKRLDPGDDLSRIVGVFDLGREFAGRHRQALVDSVRSVGGRHGSGRVARTAAEECTDLIESQGVLRCVRTEHEAIHMVEASSRGTAYDYGSGAYVGLHIDNEWLQGASFRNEKNRDFGVLGVNLGTVERYLLVVDRTAGQITRDLGQPGTAPASAERIKDEFLGRFPSHPVLQVRIEPGQGYFCNPQNLIHDGATNDSGRVDLALLVFGRFAPTAGRK
ncbi:hypothetical protein [Streptomyces sp. NPDC059015]|uniref:hypothetical protein n=1 Tax=Streptomyces sp. NPDC059015 TaxID=3346698 RepID=UPI0036C43E4D